MNYFDLSQLMTGRTDSVSDVCTHTLLELIYLRERTRQGERKGRRKAETMRMRLFVCTVYNTLHGITSLYRSSS